MIRFDCFIFFKCVVQPMVFVSCGHMTLWAVTFRQDCELWKMGAEDFNKAKRQWLNWSDPCNPPCLWHGFLAEKLTEMLENSDGWVIGDWNRLSMSWCEGGSLVATFHQGCENWFSNPRLHEGSGWAEGIQCWKFMAFTRFWARKHPELCESKIINRSKVVLKT